MSTTGGSGTWVEGDCGQSTQLVHAGVNPDPTTGAILTPIVQATTFVQESIDLYLSKGYSYSRTANPTVRALENKIAEIEHAAGATCFSTGMAATVTVMTAFMRAGDHCVITNCSYGGTNRVARKMFMGLGMEFSFVDFTDLAEIEGAIKPNTKLIFSETPANPTLTLTDLQGVSAIAKKHNIVHCCDTTFATPIITLALDHGVDIAMHSTTKYYDGHNMTVGGVIACKTAEHDAEIKFFQNMHGNVMSPMVAFLTLQATKTMKLRVLQQSQTAQKVAEFLEAHEKVEICRYPGLESFPKAQKAIADKQHKNNVHGGMLWFEVKGGTDAGRRLMDSVQRPWSLCENLGATESIITCPSVMTHANMEKEDRLKVGITDGFVRVSCGIEDTEDLIRALKVALDNL
ncbi:cystathionine gamma-synthase [Sphaeroforma arctica JP610]|uniref:plant cystathionine gamma-synthase n=1 Tax=Sphaeroforma arctica JP610 TaxID=667725 RepID=A0A0L0FZV2_9EUKA|nr:cystathionine gamma-synthase [Sphaeroforma arctica JP610]KNC82392.1 cystathionine gamma-synthase [Sphaeroforma arctica JP610]|eukprot:XP_014156294.1 cystathionine gamma-synthase [Sphaeroforma arctica JP610]